MAAIFLLREAKVEHGTISVLLCENCLLYFLKS